MKKKPADYEVMKKYVERFDAKYQPFKDSRKKVLKVLMPDPCKGGG